MSETLGSIFFEGFRLDAGGLFRASQEGVYEPVWLGSRALDLLTMLLHRHGEVLSKDAIFDAVWRGATVSESNLTVQISALRRVIDRNRERGRSCIQTIPGRGYRFIAPTTTFDPACARPAETARPEKASIAVLPFQSLTRDEDSEYFADGIAEEIITGLSLWPWLLVISRNSSFRYRSLRLNVEVIGRELGVRYLLDGSIRQAGNRVRVTAQLIDTRSGIQLWAGCFENEMNEIFALQNEVARKIVAALAPELAVNEAKRILRKPDENLSAWDAYLRGRWYYYRQSKENRLTALAWFERATELDCEFSDAHAFLSRVLHGNLVYGLSADRRYDLERAFQSAARAVELDTTNANAWRSLAQALSTLGKAHAALEAARKAVDLNPNMAEGYFALSVASVYCGQLIEALAASETAFRLNPKDPQNFAWLVPRASALYLLKRYDEAIDIALRCLLLCQQSIENYSTPHRILAASYAQLGMRKEAKEALASMLKSAGSERTIDDVVRPFLRPADREHFADGLRKAGLEIDAPNSGATAET